MHKKIGNNNPKLAKINKGKPMILSKCTVCDTNKIKICQRARS